MFIWCGWHLCTSTSLPKTNCGSMRACVCEPKIRLTLTCFDFLRAFMLVYYSTATRNTHTTRVHISESIQHTYLVYQWQMAMPWQRLVLLLLLSSAAVSARSTRRFFCVILCVYVSLLCCPFLSLHLMASKRNVLLILFTCDSLEYGRVHVNKCVCATARVVCSQYDEMIRCLPFSPQFACISLSFVRLWFTHMLPCHVLLMLWCVQRATATTKTTTTSCQFIHSLIVPALLSGSVSTYVWVCVLS